MIGFRLFAVGLILGLAACGLSEANRQTGIAEKVPASSSAIAPLDACKLISPQELGEIFAGRTFVIDNSGPVARNQQGGANKNALTTCTFVSAGVSVEDKNVVTLLVKTAPNDAAHHSTEVMKAGVKQLGLGVEPSDIPGLGDGAYWVNLGTRRSAVQVNVKHDPRIWLVVSESSSGQDVSTTVARLSDIARRVLPRI